MTAPVVTPTLLALYAVLVMSLVLVLLLNVYGASVLFWYGAARRREHASAAPMALPKITLLIAAYQEEECLAESIHSITLMDYPPGRLEVLLITESIDPPTTRLAESLAASAPAGIAFKSVVVPDGPEPRGKPRALNEGLRHATGEIIGVIDAEDIVDPQLCATVAREIVGGGLDAVQGVLDMANDYDGWLNLEFRAEYGWWFRVCIPSAAAAGYPVPFGGTTNFFTRSALVSLGGWDAWNLTEDFDIGLRAYTRGLRVGTIECVTREESPTSFGTWLRQRTRWQRGKLQTLLKILRAPRCGFRARAHALLTCLAPHVAVCNLASIVASVYVIESGGVLPSVYWNFALIAFLWSGVLCVLQGWGYLVATRDEVVAHRRSKALLCGIAAPAYWIAQWLAELRAIRQEFLERSVFWEKTDHHLRHVNPSHVERRRDWALRAEG